LNENSPACGEKKMSEEKKWFRSASACCSYVVIVGEAVFKK